MKGTLDAYKISAIGGSAPCPTGAFVDVAESLPYHEFNLDGCIERSGGGPKKNFTVVAVGRYSWGEHMLRSDAADEIDFFNPWDIALTDSTGRFFLRIGVWEPPDSIAVAVIRPDQEMIRGRFSAIAEGQPYEKIRYYNTDTGGCDGCSERHSKVEGYVYNFHNLTIAVP